MGVRPESRPERPYFTARKEAAKTREILYARDRAADLLGVSESTLCDYENGITKTIPPDMVVKMSDIYNAPHLKAMYCLHDCPIGRYMPISCEDKTLSQVAVSLACKLNPHDVEEIQTSILRICEDGVIDQSERDALGTIMYKLDAMSKAISELRLIAEKVEKGEKGHE